MMSDDGSSVVLKADKPFQILRYLFLVLSYAPCLQYFFFTTENMRITHAHIYKTSQCLQNAMKRQLGE